MAVGEGETDPYHTTFSGSVAVEARAARHSSTRQHSEILPLSQSHPRPFRHSPVSSKPLRRTEASSSLSIFNSTFLIL